MQLEMPSTYEKPEVHHWRADELNAIEAIMSGGGGYSPKPHKEDEYIFQLFPKEQTSYKSMGTTQKSVDEIRQEQDEIIAVTHSLPIDILIGIIECFEVVEPIGRIIAAGGIVLNYLANKVEESIENLESDVLLNCEKEWMWLKTTSMPYKMSFRYSMWYSYQGHQVSDSITTTRTIEFEYGGYTIH